MKKYTLLLVSLVFFGSSIFYNCTKTGQNEKVSVKDADDKTLYPNKDSELALLMRSMYEDSDLMSKEIQEGKIPTDFRAKFKKLHSAKPTDAEVKNDIFTKMGDNFLASMDEVYKPETPKEMRILAFNTMVQTCVGCHTAHCPGPIKRIKKLNIK